MLCLPIPALAATSGSPDTARLSRYEQIIFGETKSSASAASRLSTLEKNLFGKTQSGTTTARLNAIAKLLDDKTSSTLMPAQAGQLDIPSSAPAAPSNQSAHSLRSENEYSQAPTSPSKNERVTELLRQAMQKHDQRDMAGADRLFRQVLSLDPQNTDAYYNLGAIAEEHGNVDAALTNYRAALKTAPADSDLRQAVASLESKIQQRNAQKSRAEQLAREQSAQQAKQAQLKKLADQAGAAYRAGNYDAAIRNLETVVREAPGDPDVHLALSQAYRGKGDFNQARGHINQAIAADPNNSQYRNVLAQIDQQSSQSQRGPSNSPSSGQQQFADADEPPMAPSRGYDRGRQLADSNDENQGVQPFTPDVSAPRQYGYASSGGYGGGPMMQFGGGGLMGSLAGLGGSYYGGSGMGRGGRLKQAAVSGLAGAALGAVMGGITRSGVKQGAVSGFMSGALSSFMMGL